MMLIPLLLFLIIVVAAIGDVWALTNFYHMHKWWGVLHWAALTIVGFLLGQVIVLLARKKAK